MADGHLACLSAIDIEIDRLIRVTYGMYTLDRLDILSWTLGARRGFKLAAFGEIRLSHNLFFDSVTAL